MRNNLKSFIVGFLIVPAIALAGNSTDRKKQIAFNPGQFFQRNFVLNPDAELNTSNVTVSGATVTRNTTTPIEGKADFSVSLGNNATDTVTWTLGTLDSTLNGGNCELRLNYTASSIGSNVKFGVYQGSNLIASTLALATQSVANPTVSLNAPCGDISSATTVKLYNDTGNSGTSSLKIDHVYYGAATNVGSVAQAEMFGTVTLNSCSGGGLSTSTSANYVTVSSSGCSYTSTGKVTSPPSNTFGATIAVLPPGEYEIEADGYIQNNGNDACFVRFTDGTNNSSEMYFRSTTSTIFPKISGRIRYTTAQSNINIQLQFKAGGTNSCFVFAPTQFRLKRFPLESEIAYRPELQALSWSGYHSGSGCSWGIASTNWGDPGDNASCGFTTRNSTNLTVSSLGSNKPGIVFTPPKTGTFDVSAKLTCNNSGSSATFYQMVDGASNVLGTGVCAGNPNQTVTIPGELVVTSLAQQTVKIQIAATTGTGYITTQSSGGTGGATAIDWTLSASNQNLPAPVLVGSVTSSYIGTSKLEWAKVTSTCTSSPCTVSSSSGADWLTSITRSSAGTYQANFQAGYSMSHCWVVGLGSTIHSSYGNATLPTATTYNFTNISSGVATDSQFELFCLMTR